MIVQRLRSWACDHRSDAIQIVVNRYSDAGGFYGVTIEEGLIRRIIWEVRPYEIDWIGS